MEALERIALALDVSPSLLVARPEDGDGLGVEQLADAVLRDGASLRNRLVKALGALLPEGEPVAEGKEG